jgi:hypothetical protein
MGEMRNVYKILVGKPEGTDHSEDLGINVEEGTITLQWIPGKVWTGFIWLRTENRGRLL